MKNLQIFNELYRPKVFGFNPNTLGTLVGWWKFNEGVTSSGGLISEVTDFSTTNKPLKQTTATNKPTLATAFKNGLNVGQFDGSNDWMALDSSINGLSSTSFFIVYRRSANTSQAVLSDGASSYHYLQYGSAFYVGNNQSAQAMTNDVWYIRAGVAVAGGTGTKYYSNGTFLASIAGGADNFQTFRYLATAGGAYLNGYVAEIWLYSTALSDAQILTGSTALNAKWAIY